MRAIVSLAAFAAATAGFQAPASAQDFYAGKTISIVVGLSPGGGYDVYARFLARHMGRHIPGKPAMVVENKPGAATATASAHVYRAAVKDGTVIGMSLNMLPLYQVLFPEKVNFDFTKARFVGNMATLTSAIAVSDRSPVKTVADMTRSAANLGSNGVLSETYIIPAVLNVFAGAKFNVVMGYPGTSVMDVAIERGELDGRGGQWNSFVVARPDWVKSGKILPLIQIGMEEDAHMKGVPQLNSLAKDDRQRAIYRILSQLPRFSRAFWVAPEVPAERIAILRAAFVATMQDKEFLAEAEKSKLEITPTAPKDLEDAVAELAATPPAVLDVLRDILRKAG